MMISRELLTFNGQRIFILLIFGALAIQSSVEKQALNSEGFASQIDNISGRLPKPKLLIVEPPVDVRVNEGREIALSCHTNDPEHSRISWLFNDKELNLNLSHKSFNNSSTTLVIKSAKTSDSGRYTCLAKSTARDDEVAESSANVLVIGTSKLIRQGPTNQSLLIGSNVQMPCHLSSENSGQVSWRRNGQKIPQDGDILRRISIGQDGTLWINQVGPDNIGEYECLASTASSANESATAWLTIIEKPSMPQSVRAELSNETTPARVRVAWEPGFDGNSPITKYTVEMRTMGTTGLWSDWESIQESPAKKCCSMFVENVRPSATAEFRVVAFNRYGHGRPSQPSQNVTMPQQPPAAAPTQVRASARSSSSIMVQWLPPENDVSDHLPVQNLADDNIRGYLVRYRLSGYATADWNEKNVNDSQARNAPLEPLITWRDYEIQVAAYNDRGLGVFSKPIVVTTLEGVPIQSPQNVRLDVLNSTGVSVSFDPPNQQMIPGVNQGYRIEIWKGVPGQQPPFRAVRIYPQYSRIVERIGGLERWGLYNLTVLCYTAPGDGPRSDPIEFRTLEDAPGPVKSLEFFEVFFSSVIVQWEPPTHPNGVIQKYVLEHWETGLSREKRRVEVSAHETNLTIEGLKPSTEYTVAIYAATKIGPGPKTEARFTSGVTPELPGPPSALVVSNIEARKATLKFALDFDGHSAIRQWKVEARIGASSIFEPIFNVSLPKATSFTVSDLRPYTNYQLRLIAENLKGRSPPSEPSRPFRTLESNPESAPDRMFAEPVSARQVLVDWTPLLSHEWNGEPVGYVVQYRRALNDDDVDKGAEGFGIEEETDKMSSDDDGHWEEVVVTGPRRHQATISSLRPFTVYQFRIAAESAFGRSDFSSPPVTATTYESVPTASPTVDAELVGRNGIRVRWGELDSEQANGVVLGYKVYIVPENETFRAEHSRSVETTAAEPRSTTFRDLRHFSAYQVFVAALTLIGEGPRQNSSDSPKTIGTGEYLPDPPSNVRFVYKNTTEVRLSWEPPLEPNGEILAYGVLYWRSTESQAKPTAIPYTEIPHNLFTFSVTNLAPHTLYTFAIRAQTTVGSSEDRVLRVLTVPENAPLPVPPVPRRNPNSPQSSSQLNLVWDLPSSTRTEFLAAADESSPVRCVELEFQKANEDRWSSGKKSSECIPPEQAVKGYVLRSLQSNTAYRTRIRFVGDFNHRSSWSAESDWMKTMESAPSAPPSGLLATPFESSSVVVRWKALERDRWNADRIGYRIYYRVYPSSDQPRLEEVPLDEAQPDGLHFERTIRRLTSFRHYVVEVRSFNALDESAPSRPPVFVFVGYSVPQQHIRNLTAEPISSTSLRLAWSNWTANPDDLIDGYRIRYVPLLSTLSPETRAEAEGRSDALEEMVLTERCEHTLTELRKFTEYQIFVTGYNRAGDSQPSVTRMRTLEDVPGPVGAPIFRDVLLDSVNVSWAPPAQPNGLVRGYVINYRTFKSADEFRKEVQLRSRVPWLFVDGLREAERYVFVIRAETAAGPGAETMGNITIGYNPGAPEAPVRPTVIPEQSNFLLRWDNAAVVGGNSPIKGYLIQAKRVGTAMNHELVSTSTAVAATKRGDKSGFGNRRHFDHTSSSGVTIVPVRHVIGEWFTVASVYGDADDDEYRLSYRQLEPASFYVFRVLARNSVGVGRPSAESEQLHVPASLPDDPFYTKWWFLVIVALLILIVVMLFAALLFFTSSSSTGYGKKSGKTDAFDTLQLSDGGIVSYELHSKHLRRNEELLSRPNTAGTWLSASRGQQNNNGIMSGPAMYGSVDGLGIGGCETGGRGGRGSGGSLVLPNMYSALATDALPPADGSQRNSRNSDDAADFVYQKHPQQRQNPQNSFRTDTPTYQLRNFDATNALGSSAGTTATAMGGYGQYRHFLPDGNSDGESGSEEGDGGPEKDFVAHYALNSGHDEARATWRRNKMEQAARQQLPTRPSLPGTRPPSRPDQQQLQSLATATNSIGISLSQHQQQVGHRQEQQQHPAFPRNNHQQNRPSVSTDFTSMTAHFSQVPNPSATNGGGGASRSQSQYSSRNGSFSGSLNELGVVGGSSNGSHGLSSFV